MFARFLASGQIACEQCGLASRTHVVIQALIERKRLAGQKFALELRVGIEGLEFEIADAARRGGGIGGGFLPIEQDPLGDLHGGIFEGRVAGLHHAVGVDGQRAAVGGDVGGVRGILPGEHFRAHAGGGHRLAGIEDLRAASPAGMKRL